MLCCLPRKLISCGSLACVASVSVWSREENGAGNALPFPSFIFLAVVPFFCVVKTENQSFSAPKQQGTRLLRMLVVPISSMNPWITAGAMTPDEFRIRVYSLRTILTEYCTFYFIIIIFLLSHGRFRARMGSDRRSREDYEGGSLSKEKTLPAPISPWPLICMRMALRKERRPLAVTYRNLKITGNQYARTPETKGFMTSPNVR